MISLETRGSRVSEADLAAANMLTHYSAAKCTGVL